MADVTRPDVRGALERALALADATATDMERWTQDAAELRADVALLRELADALADTTSREVGCADVRGNYRGEDTYCVDRGGAPLCGPCRLARLLSGSAR